ncbi:hypothetical protein CJP72_12355 [Citrobacter sp. NCU1]|uniref:hypothetical protein n=1 Tax=Citrobacter sp. NCU1 TaxID=2026683 RepID=UPI00139119DD|nr:hypothetical protein [Citrobacter sp. NCU1]NDO81528.1 hypothetical protein [Citrobacter sp. NCU1]
MRKHYFNVSFVGEKGQFRSAVIALDHNAMTIPDIESARRSLEMDDSTGLMSVSHLGRMTEQEYFQGIDATRNWNRWGIVASCMLPFVILALVVWLQR